MAAYSWRLGEERLGRGRVLPEGDLSHCFVSRPI